jgi:uncharacterized protein YyaL (SSP411 family)
MLRSISITAGLFAITASSLAIAQDDGTVRPPAILRADPKQEAGPKTPQKPVYDEKADAKQQIADALAKAKKENRRVLIQWGGNWCPWCVKLHELFKVEPQVARTLLYEYDVVYVDAGKPEGKNMDLASTYGADLKKNGFPYLTILDANGKPLANQATGELEVDGSSVAAGHDPKKVIEFLTKYQAGPEDAAKLLDSALARAKSDGKAVFVHFGAPWCGWCHKLENWMGQDTIAPLLAKDLVDLKIDIDRTTGGKALLSRFAGTDKTGIPWFVFLDPDGKPLADSNATPGDATTNVGFPSAVEEIALFEQALKKACKRLTPAEQKTIIASLAPKK